MKTRNRQEKKTEVPISSMIDIIFLLIIFFVVTASIDKELEDEMVELAKAPFGKPISKDPRRFVINIHKNGDVNVAGRNVSMGTLSDLLSNAAFTYGEDLPIVIRGDKNVYHGHIRNVMESVQRIKLYKVKFKALK